MAATTNIVTIAYFLTLISDWDDTNPAFPIKVNKTGSWKQTPNAKMNLIVRLRYSFMVPRYLIPTRLFKSDVFWKLRKKLKASGRTTKYANAAPTKNNIGEAIKKGKKANFSFLYKPGAINRQIWNPMKGNETMKPPKKDILTLTIKPCWSPVKIRSLDSFWFESSSVIGVAKKSNIYFENGNTQTMQIRKASTTQISLDRNSERCSMSGAFDNSISACCSWSFFID